MITVTARLEDNTEIAQIRIEKVDGNTEFADYMIQFSVERCGAIGVYSNMVYAFPRKHLNVLALLLAGLQNLHDDQLELENAPVSDADLARRFEGTLREIQARQG